MEKKEKKINKCPICGRATTEEKMEVYKQSLLASAREYETALREKVRKLQEESERLLKENTELRDECGGRELIAGELMRKNEENTALKLENERLRNRSFLDRLFNK